MLHDAGSVVVRIQHCPSEWLVLSVQIVVVGVNHATCPLDVRERLTVPPGELAAALDELKSVAREGLIVATCNRMEVYGLVGHPVSGADVLLRFLADRSGVDLSTVRAACYVHVHEDAVRHALRVASGLDSMVLGEDQIQGQVKRAIGLAREIGTLGSTLERLGSAALACGKRVRTFTGIGRHAGSLETLAVRAAAERLDGLATKHVLVVGAGESASLIARNLKSAGAARITIVSRSLARARALAATVGADVRPVRELSGAVAEADALFACASAAKPVITTATLERRVASHACAPLLCVDFGMPRGVDDAARSLPGVSVLSLDELSTMAAAHRAARREHIPAAESIVNAEAARFLEWSNSRGVAQAIVGLNAHADKRELERVMPRLRKLSPQHREIVTELAHRIVRKLVHRPINALKNHPEAENMALVMETLFGDAGARDALQQQLSAIREPAAEESAS